MIDIGNILLLLTLLIAVTLLVYNLIQKQKKLQNYIYMGISVVLSVWVLNLMLMDLFAFDQNTLRILDSNTYIGVTTVPALLLISSIVYTRNLEKLPWKVSLLFIVPFITIIIVFTNPLHHLHYINFSTDVDKVVFGPYMYVHAIYSYLCILLAFFIMVRFAVKNAKYYTRQILLFCIGYLIPMIVSLLATMKIFNLPITATPMSFAIGLCLHALAIFRYQFLNIAPIALQNAMDRITDCYAVINHQMMMVDYNKSLFDTFGSVFNIKRNSHIATILQGGKALPKVITNLLINKLNDVKEKNVTVHFETSFKIQNEPRFFYMEFTPINVQKMQVGIIILIRDITRAKLDMERIKRNQAMLMERERLASLGQLIGGIAHNLKTPIMSISGSVLALEELVEEYRDSAGDSSVTIEDHHEIADEMVSWLMKIKPYCSYMSEIISTVKDQAVQMNASSEREFSVNELVKRVQLLMNNELKRFHCTLDIENRLKKLVLLRGDINNLVQVLDNLILNAKDSYEGNPGKIILGIDQQQMQLLIRVCDFGSGIAPEIQPRLFKEMITSKGTEGTGLGLYMSYVAIKGKFGGELWFETEMGKGTCFNIRIPISDLTSRSLSEQDMQPAEKGVRIK
jgi:two-component system, NtrC family, sensor histidine kinase HupT/HoxJ